MATKYSIYSNSDDRFLLISDDLWTTMHTAKMLCSKMSLSVCNLGEIEDIENVLLWGLSDPNESNSGQQHPAYCIIKKGIEYKGNPEVDFNILNEHQRYVLFVNKAVRASWLTDALFNNTNQDYYLSLLGERKFHTVKDDSGVRDGFLFSIDRVLYTSMTQEEAELRFMQEVFDFEKSSRPTSLKLYSEKFHSILAEL
jgi:hypothetical protein